MGTGLAPRTLHFPPLLLQIEIAKLAMVSAAQVETALKENLNASAVEVVDISGG